MVFVHLNDCNLIVIWCLRFFYGFCDLLFGVREISGNFLDILVSRIFFGVSDFRMFLGYFRYKCGVLDIRIYLWCLGYIGYIVMATKLQLC